MTRPARSPEAAQFSLFEVPAPVARVPMPSAGPQVVDAAAVDVDSVLAAVAPPAVPPPPAVFHHPQADREIRLQQHVVGYALKRAPRRSIGFMVGADGLSVSVPKWIGVGDIESALQEKAGWILRKLVEQQDRSRRLADARIEWRDGTTIPYLGEPLVVVLDPGLVASKRPSQFEAAGTNAAAGAQALLRIALPETTTPAQLRDAVQVWLKHRARQVFAARCQVFAARLDVRCTRLRLSSAQTRWGSASVDGSIRLNWRLIHFALPTIDYVVTHELAHLREMNHSARFWSVVRSVLPEFEQARDALKQGSVPMFD